MARVPRRREEREMKSERVNPGHAGELPCVWSLAGVLAPHPCDREYDCESCDLYHALSGRCAPGDRALGRGPIMSQAQRQREAELGRIVSNVLDGCCLDLGRWYGGDGIWVSPGDSEGELEVGLVGCIWRILQPIQEVVPPRPGVEFESTETCGWILRSDRAIPIRIPIGGTVREVNEALIHEIQTCGRLDGPDRWLFRVRSAVLPREVDRLFRGEDALIWHLRRLRVLKGHLRAVLGSGEAGVGPVMADGGEPATNLETILGPQRFGALLGSLF
jgi:glycine cleavage system H lipoate-binding protein